MCKILLFIPAYNCNNQISRVLDKVKKIDDLVSGIIIVDNKSKDNTLSILKEEKKQLNSKYKIIENEQNYGLGGSHKVAFEYAISNNFDYVIVLHGDDQADINNLKLLLENKEYKNYDCLLGSRFMKNSVLKGYSKFRIFGNIIYNNIFSFILNKKVYDLGSGLNMYDVNMLKNKYYKKFPDNLVFNYCMILATDFYNQNVKFFPISWREEDQVSNVKMLSQSTQVLSLLLKYRLNKRKFMKEDHRINKIDEYRFKEIG